MACCGKSVGVVQATPTDDWVSMRYLGTNSGVITFEGYLKRRYRVARGSIFTAHPDDVKKLMDTGKFRLNVIQAPAALQVQATPEPVAKVEAKATAPEGIDATDTAVSLAAEHGIDLATVTGTGAGGKIVLRDVKALID